MALPSIFTRRRPKMLGLTLLACSAALGAAAHAQNSATPQTIPGLDRYRLPGVPEPTPTPAPLPTAPVNLPTPAPTPTPDATPVAEPAATPAATPREAELPTAQPTADIAPPLVASSGATRSAPAPALSAPPVVTDAPTPAPSVVPEEQPASSSRWWWVLLIAALALGAAGWFAWRLRKSGGARAADRPTAPATPPQPPSAPAAPSSAPVGPPPAASTAPNPPTFGRPLLDIALNPRRAGTNLTSAAVEYEVEISNPGPVEVHDIALDIRLLTASAAQDAAIAAIFAAPIEQSLAAPFTLAAGESTTLSGRAMMPREAVNAMAGGDRAVFVPLVTVNAVCREGQATRAFMIGADRGTSAKLAPFVLDDVRMHMVVRAIPYEVARG